MSCTMPKVLGFHRWFQDRFGDLCKAHDEAYEARLDRKQADIILAAGIALRGYPVLGILCYVSVRLCGKFHYKVKI